MLSFVMFFRRPRNSSALMSTTRPLDVYQYSHILLLTFRISNLIRLSTVANLPLPPISRSTLVVLPTTSTSLNHCLLVLNKPLRQLPQPKPISIAATPPSGSATTRLSTAASGIGGPNLRTNPKGKNNFLHSAQDIPRSCPQGSQGLYRYP